MATHTQAIAHPLVLPTKVVSSPPPMRFSIEEATVMLSMGRTQLYARIRNGAIKSHKDGARTYITRSELERYVDSCG